MRACLWSSHTGSPSSPPLLFVAPAQPDSSSLSRGGSPGPLVRSLDAPPFSIPVEGGARRGASAFENIYLLLEIREVHRTVSVGTVPWAPEPDRDLGKLAGERTRLVVIIDLHFQVFVDSGFLPGSFIPQPCTQDCGCGLFLQCQAPLGLKVQSSASQRTAVGWKQPPHGSFR